MTEPNKKDASVKKNADKNRAATRVMTYLTGGFFASEKALTESADVLGPAIAIVCADGLADGLEGIDTIGAKNIEHMSQIADTLNLLGNVAMVGSLFSIASLGFYSVYLKTTGQTAKLKGFHLKDRLLQASMQVSLISCKIASVATPILLPLAIAKSVVEIGLCLHMAYKEMQQNKKSGEKKIDVPARFAERVISPLVGITLCSIIIATAAAPSIPVIATCVAAYLATKALPKLKAYIKKSWSKKAQKQPSTKRKSPKWAETAKEKNNESEKNTTVTPKSQI